MTGVLAVFRDEDCMGQVAVATLVLVVGVTAAWLAVWVPSTSTTAAIREILILLMVFNLVISFSCIVLLIREYRTASDG